MIENKLLVSFVAVAEELHFGRAAARLNLAQPALSRQIMQLEDRLRVRLFERTQRSVQITEPGRVFLERARRILSDLGRATDEVVRIAGGQEGRLRVGFIHSSTFGVSPPIFRAFRRAYPKIEMELFEMTIADQLIALENDTIDVGILRPPIANARLQTAILRDEHFVLAVPGDHPLAARDRVRLNELYDEDFVLFSQISSPLFSTRTLSMCDQAGFLPRIVQNATQIHTILGLVSANMGISIVPDVAREVNMRNIKILDIEDNPPPVHVVIAWRSSDGSPSVNSFVRTARHWMDDQANI